MNSHSKRKYAFTLLELLVVVAILAIIAGGIIVAYDGLETQSAQGMAAFNLGALDKAIRTFASVNKTHPDQWDSLLYSPSGAATDATVLNIMPQDLKGKLSAYPLTPNDVAALNEAGIFTARYVTSPYSNDGTANAAIPNRIFDNPSRGSGTIVELEEGVVVAIVESLGTTDFLGGTNTSPSDPGSQRLRDIAGFDETASHIVVAFGIGNNSTLVSGDTERNAGLSEAPVYSNVAKHEYSRFIALYHLASNGQYHEKAHFLGVIDTKGNWYDEELAEYTGQKH